MQVCSPIANPVPLASVKRTQADESCEYYDFSEADVVVQPPWRHTIESSSGQEPQRARTSS